MAKKRANDLKGTLDEQMDSTEYIKVNSWGKIVTYLKRQFDQWATERLTENGYANFKMAYMPVLMNISLQGTNNNEVAKYARVTKQAMSKVLKELSDDGYIKTKVDPNDKRSSIVMLTDKGKRLVIEARLCVKDLTEEYKNFLGEKDYEFAVEILWKIIHYNDSKIKN